MVPTSLLKIAAGPKKHLELSFKLGKSSKLASCGDGTFVSRGQGVRQDAFVLEVVW